jgi:hypothetical protein
MRLNESLIAAYSQDLRLEGVGEPGSAGPHGQLHAGIRAVVINLFIDSDLQRVRQNAFLIHIESSGEAVCV